MQRIINKKELQNKIEGLLKEFEIIGPREVPNKGIFYQSLKDSKDLYLGEGFSIEPIKKFFLPPFEEVFRYNGDILTEHRTPNTEHRIIIAARPCETRGLTLLDKVFDADYKDDFYVHNRKRTVIVGLACSRPDKTCFCTSMDGSCVDSRGMDALLFDAGDKFIIEIRTDRGKELFDGSESFPTRHPEDPDPERSEGEGDEGSYDKEKSKELVEKSIKVPVSLDKVFASDYWNEVSMPCVSCGVCTYLCPTCHCFDLVDEERKKLRCYDGCSFQDFTLEASGENPRPTKKERYRQRVYHKFDYFKRNFGENLCVGCGRCIRYCPVKIDIADVVDRAPE